MKVAKLEEKIKRKTDVNNTAMNLDTSNVS